MVRSIFLGAGAVLMFASLAGAQPTAAGHWDGVLRTDESEIGVSLDIAKDQQSQWIASMGVPSQNAAGLYVKDLVVNGTSVKFMAVELQMSTFDLTLGPDGRLTGTMKSRRSSVPIEFKRTGEPKVVLAASSPAVSKELEGDWDGSLQAPNGAEFRMTIHFRNRADRTVEATIDVPATNSFGMPLNDVKQTGPKVEFGIKIAHSNFAGTMNKDGTEIVGQWGHEADARALTLRKK